VVTLSPGAVERIVDPDAATTTPPPPGGVKAPPPAPDTAAPQLRVSVSGRPSLATRRRLRVAIRSDEAATVRIAGRLRGVASFRTARANLAAGRQAIVTVRLTKTAARRLRGTLRRKRVIAALTIAASDTAGNTRAVARRLTIPRR
jgi:hypothetical protein